MKKIVLAFGTFDILHPGHINFLLQAKDLGDYLIVSLARDKFIRKIKGHKANHSESERKTLLGAIKYVDKVVLGSKTDYLKHIISQKPNIIALGYDQKAFTEGLKEKLLERGFAVDIVRLKSYGPSKYKSKKILSRI